MDTAITVAAISAVGGIVIALIAWHSNTANARANLRNATIEAADRTRREYTAELEQARAATDRERENLLGLRNKRLDEMANQLGSARQSLAIARKECAALRSENAELRAEIAALRGDRSEYGGPP